MSDLFDRAGVDNVAVASIYHSGKFLLPHNPRRKIYFPRSGTLYFRPDPRWYGKLAITPPRWPTAVEHDFWPTLRTQIRDRGGELTAWCLGLHSSGVGETHPEFAVENAFGDVLTTELCPNNTEVIEYLATAVSDAAAATGAGRMLLESFEYMPFQHGFHHEVIGVPVPPGTALMLTLCFCSACRRRAASADIDAERLRAWVIRQVQQHFEDPFAATQSFEWAEMRARCDGVLGEYLDMRIAAVTDLLRVVTDRLREGSSAKVGLVDFGPLYATGCDAGSWESGLDLARAARFVDELHPAFYLPDPEAHSASVEEYLHVAPHDVEVHGAVRAILPQVGSAEALGRYLAPMDGRVDGVSFYNYGFMAPQAMDWVKDSVSGFRWR